MLLLTAQNMGEIFGFELNLGEKTNEIMAAVTPLLSALVLMGVVVDPTTEGVGDSARALTYDEPKPTTPPPTQRDCMNCENYERCDPYA
jgi:phi LC3 family holin